MGKRELGEVAEVCPTVDTGDIPPVRQLPRRVAYALRSEITRMVDDMVEADVVQESSSPWASSIVLVRKTALYAFCMDYRRLNAVTRKDVYPLPHIDDLLDQLSGKRIFSTLDASTGYWQIRMEEKSVEKTAFVTMDGLYEFRVMPFGLCNTPATFQCLMQKALRGLPFCSVFIDDIVFSDSMDAHLEHLKQVFDRLWRIRLKCILRSAVSSTQRSFSWDILCRPQGFGPTQTR